MPSIEIQLVLISQEGSLEITWMLHNMYKCILVE